MFVAYAIIVLMALSVLVILTKVVLEIVHDMRLEEQQNRISHRKVVLIIFGSILLYIGVMIAILTSIYSLIFME